MVHKATFRRPELEPELELEPILSLVLGLWPAELETLGAAGTSMLLKVTLLLASELLCSQF